MPIRPTEVTNYRPSIPFYRDGQYGGIAIYERRGSGIEIFFFPGGRLWVETFDELLRVFADIGITQFCVEDRVITVETTSHNRSAFS